MRNEIAWTKFALCVPFFESFHYFPFDLPDRTNEKQLNARAVLVPLQFLNAVWHTKEKFIFVKQTFLALKSP